MTEPGAWARELRDTFGAKPPPPSGRRAASPGRAGGRTRM